MRSKFIRATLNGKKQKTLEISNTILYAIWIEYNREFNCSDCVVSFLSIVISDAKTKEKMDEESSRMKTIVIEIEFLIQVLNYDSVLILVEKGIFKSFRKTVKLNEKIKVLYIACCNYKLKLKTIE